MSLDEFRSRVGEDVLDTFHQKSITPLFIRFSLTAGAHRGRFLFPFERFHQCPVLQRVLTKFKKLPNGGIHDNDSAENAGEDTGPKRSLATHRFKPPPQTCEIISIQKKVIQAK